MLTPAVGKRLIGKALAVHPAIRTALNRATILILAGTTNGYIAEEILSTIGEKGFSKNSFFRGVMLPPNRPTTDTGKLKDNKFNGDVMIVRGKWQKNVTIVDVIDTLKEGDIILKGANAIDPVRKQAAVLIGDNKAGTYALAIQAVAGRRVRLIIPVGLEKRVYCDLNAMSVKMNQPGAGNYRLLPMTGEIFTELDAITLLTGATAELVSAGGIGGAEGSLWLAINGTPDQEEAAMKLIRSLSNEPLFGI